MEKVALIIRKTYIDDSAASIAVDVKTCDSVENARASVLKELNEGFESNCKTLAEMACMLADGGVSSKIIGDGKCDTFTWYDNGTGNEFIICEAGNDYTNIYFGDDYE